PRRCAAQCRCRSEGAWGLPSDGPAARLSKHRHTRRSPPECAWKQYAVSASKSARPFVEQVAGLSAPCGFECGEADCPIGPNFQTTHTQSYALGGIDRTLEINFLEPRSRLPPWRINWLSRLWN